LASITISLPEPLRDWIERRVESGRFGTASDYVRELVRRDQEDSDEREALVAELQKGEASGTSGRAVPDILRSLREELGGRSG
jgi:antitoxin ParD1/3/4